MIFNFKILIYRDEYAADLHFLEDQVWPDIKHIHIAHDSYCCDRYPNTKPFPTRRAPTYQHVGQVFDGEGNPRCVIFYYKYYQMDRRGQYKLIVVHFLFSVDLLISMGTSGEFRYHPAVERKPTGFTAKS